MALVLIRKKKYFLIALEKEIKSHFNCKTQWLMEHGMPTGFFADSGQESGNTAKVVLTNITIRSRRLIYITFFFLQLAGIVYNMLMVPDGACLRMGTEVRGKGRQAE